MTPQLPIADSWRFLRFVLVGAVGFVVDAGVLQALISLAAWGPVEARAVAIPTAVLNRTITFPESHGGHVVSSLLRYAAVSAVGAGVNFIVFSILVFASQAMAAQPVVPLAIASVVALIVNYLGSKHFAFH